jgi:hypothetical protein
MDAFPALTRAKQRFLARQQQTATQPTALLERAAVEHGASKRKRLLGTVATAAMEPSPTLLLLMQHLCIDLDDDVASLTAVVDSIDSSIRRDHQELSADLETLTTRFLDGNHPMKLVSESLPAATSRRVANTVTCSIMKKKKKPKCVVVRHAPSLLPRPRSRLIPKQRHMSRVALLALQAVHAHVIQHHFRRYLYTRLYRRGGKQQFALACAMRKRSVLLRAWRRWRQFCHQRMRRRRRLLKQSERLRGDNGTQRSVEIAQQVLQSDGKYVFAKRFHETQLLCRAFSAWLVHTVELDKADKADNQDYDDSVHRWYSI